MRLAEIQPVKPGKPLTPRQAQARAEKRADANAKVADVRKLNAVKLAAAQRKAARL